jgi:hypothetical protein
MMQMNKFFFSGTLGELVVIKFIYNANMKIAIKPDINFRHTRRTHNYPFDELSVVVIQFQDDGDSTDFTFNTIDYKVEDFKPSDYLSFIDFTNDLGVDFKHDVFFVIEKSEEGLVLTQDFHDSLQIKYKIDPDELAWALDYIAEDNDFSYLESMLIPVDSTGNAATQVSSNNALPTLEDYLQQYSSEMKRVYYPGAGMDFSPLQIFGRNVKGLDCYFTDYSMPIFTELLAVIERLENSVKTSILTPQDFNQVSWEDFWPTNIDKSEMMGKDPSKACGRKFEFHTKNLNCTLTYLGTEGVQTARILCENQLAPDVLVLQDNAGCTNYALFSGENSFLHQAMKHSLPKYILIDPTGAEETKIWSGYEQVTQVYIPKAYKSLPQNRNTRALFKKIKD